MKIKKHITTITIMIMITILFLSCKSNQKSLELSIINKEVYAYCSDEECLNAERVNEGNIDKKHINVVKFKIKNNSNKTYFLMPVSKKGIKGSLVTDAFPNLFSGISLNNLIIKDQNDEIVKSSAYSFHDSDYQIKSAEHIEDYFKKVGYPYKKSKGFFMGLSQKIIIVIPANETIYLESYLILPLNKPSYSSSPVEVIKLDKNENYSVSLIFSAEKNLVEKRLTNAQKETIKHNNYKIFDGELISTNSVPIIFKD